MAEMVARGVWWLHGTRGSNAFLAETEFGLALIDTGFASSVPGLVEDIERVRPGLAVTHVLLTHAHVDHVGAAADIRSRYGAAVAAGAGDCVLNTAGAPVLRDSVERRHRPRRLVRSLLGRAAAVPEVRVDEVLVGQRSIAGILAVPVPGHTPGSYCFVLEDRGIAFVGDLVISHRRGLSRPMKVANTDDAQYLDSLRQFALLAPDIGCPGHGHPVTSGFGEQLRELSTFPRRSFWSPRGALERARRMRDFGSAITHVRRHPSSKHVGEGDGDTPAG